MLLASIDGLVRQTIQRTLRAHFRPARASIRDEVEDIRSEVTVALLRRLRDPDAGLDDIRNIPAYAATVASRACYAHLRRRYPAWTRLKNQVRYVATHDDELRLRNSGTDVPRCELLSSRNLRAAPGHDVRTMALRDVVKKTLRDAGGSMELNDLVGAVAGALGIRDAEPVAADAVNVESIAEVDDRVDAVELLKKVWEEVCQLPVRQRAALLLNLRDADGRGVVALFPLTAIASMPQIADALAMTSSELARLWDDLPLDDNRIAARLGVTRQQVINLRKSARARLGRRLMVIGAGSAHLHG